MTKNHPWHPHVTVATIVERDGKFLFVSEYDQGKLVYNQPAGHLEQGETIQDAALRETLEETGYACELTYALGIRHTVSPSGVTYIRHTFAAKVFRHRPDLTLDPDIEAVHWLSAEECEVLRAQHRSPVVAEDMLAYRNGARFPLSMYFAHPSVYGADGV